jgi:hypothetical protein
VHEETTCNTNRVQANNHRGGKQMYFHLVIELVVVHDGP